MRTPQKLFQMAQTRYLFALFRAFSTNSAASATKFLLSLALACTLSTGSLAAQQSSSTPAGREATSPGKTPKKAREEPKTDTSQEIDIPVPDGVPVKGIKVPSYSADGKLLMMLDAELARKLDADRIEFENLKIDAYSDDDKKIYVELPRSIFNLTTRILTSESRVLIRREDFELVGDAGEFYTKNRFAKILGNVKMTIFSTENFDRP
ncbi:MAG: hypothetical protein ABW214_02455 [Terrimicrobiaceae bacterium]